MQMSRHSDAAPLLAENISSVVEFQRSLLPYLRAWFALSVLSSSNSRAEPYLLWRDDAVDDVRRQSGGEATRVGREEDDARADLSECEDLRERRLVAADDDGEHPRRRHTLGGRARTAWAKVKAFFRAASSTASGLTARSSAVPADGSGGSFAMRKCVCPDCNEIVDILSSGALCVWRRFLPLPAGLPFGSTVS